jgi:SPP1 family predicted phage head-tail adaptor
MAVLRSTFSSLASKFLNDTFADFAKDISIIEDIETDNGRGGTTTERVSLANTICFIFPMAGKENLESGGLYSDQMFKFSMKPVTDLTNKMIILYNGFDYKIESIEDIVEANVWIDVIAEKDYPR